MVYDTGTSQEPVGREKEHISCFDISKKKLIRFWRAKESNFKNEKKKRKDKKKNTEITQLRVIVRRSKHLCSLGHQRRAWG